MDGYSYGFRDVGGEKVHLSRAKAYGRTFGTGDVVGCLITLPDCQDIASAQRKRVPLRYKGQMYFEMEEYLVQKEMEALVDREGKAALAARAEAEGAKDVLLGDVKGKKGVTTKNAKKSKANREPAGPITRSLPTLDGSSIEFFLNGSSLGTAFTDLYDFALLPALSTHLAPSGRKHDTAKEVMRDDGTLGYFPMISCFGKGKVRANFAVPWLAPPQNLPVNARPMEARWVEWREAERVLDERDELEATVRITKEMRDDEVRRKVAEKRMAAVRDGSGSGTPKKKAKVGPAAKKRKTMVDGTLSPSVGPTPRPTPTPVPEGKNTPTAEDVIMRDPDSAVGTSEHFKIDIENVGSSTMSRGPSGSSRADTEFLIEVKQEPLDTGLALKADKVGEGMHVDEGDHEGSEEGVRW